MGDILAIAGDEGRYCRCMQMLKNFYDRSWKNGKNENAKNDVFGVREKIRPPPLVKK